MEKNNELLKIQDLHVDFAAQNSIRAVAGVSLSIKPNTTIGLIGESGCGKSVLAHAVMQLLPKNASVKGEILYKGSSLLGLKEAQMRKIRGNEIALIPQNPSKSLNPVLRIKTQVVEALQKKGKSSIKEAVIEILGLLKKLNLPQPEMQLNRYPHQLSGGMNQRILAAIGMAGEPSLLIADEPTKGLDAVNRYQVVKLFEEVKEQLGSALLLITHDLKVASYLCDEIGVMYKGQLVEYIPANILFKQPKHPYTEALLNSLPGNAKPPFKHHISPMQELVYGCGFYHSCSYALSECKNGSPPLFNLNRGHAARCFLFDKGRKPEEEFSSFLQTVP